MNGINDYPRGYDCKIFDKGLNCISWNKTFVIEKMQVYLIKLTYLL